MAPAYRHDHAMQRRLQAHLTAPRLLDQEGSRRAAVALAVSETGDGCAGLLLTRRAHGLRTNPGQWALPGGRLDDGETVSQAAARELHEELGIPPRSILELGRLDDYRTQTGFVISPVVVWLSDDAAVVPNAAEVASVHPLTLDELDRDGEPLFVEVKGAHGPVLQLPILGTRLHAPTGAILYQFRERGLHGRDVDVNSFHEPPFAWR
jgi:8-oxo-dGTP pyrophosphatase MutT (NUDIX family)